MQHLVTVLLCSVLVSVGCRPEPPEPDPALLEWEGPAGFDAEPLDGPDPWVSGERRLNLGLFYEGGASDFIAIDNESSNYYIFLTADGSLTYDQIEEPDPVEGLVSSRVSRTGTAWLGGGIVWNAPRSLATWTRMYVSLKSSAASFADLGIGMETEGGGGAELSMADYGYINDGQWHHLVIPLSDFAEAGIDLERVTAPFIISSDGGPTGDYIKIDALYLTDE